MEHILLLVVFFYLKLSASLCVKHVVYFMS